jgi:hypothetical protein
VTEQLDPLAQMIHASVCPDTINGWLWYCDECDTHGNADSEAEAEHMGNAHVEWGQCEGDGMYEFSREATTTPDEVTIRNLQAQLDALQAELRAHRHRLSNGEDRALRARRYADAAISGDTLTVIGAREGLTRERVRQIIRDGGLTAEVQAAKAERSASAAAEAQAERERRALDRKLTVFQERGSGAQRIPDDEIIAQLRAWLAAGGSGTTTDWAAEGRSPSTSLILERFGWAKAIRLAGGIPTREYARPRRDYRTPEECLDAVVAFLADPDARLGGPASYSAWAVPRGLPGDQTVRKRLGGWRNAKRAALQELGVSS